MPSFSKKSLNPQPAEPARRLDAAAIARTAIANPYMSAGGAAFLLLLTIVTMIAVGGDPKAGQPSVRISLARVAGPLAPPGWREALAPERAGDPLVSEAVFQLSPTPLEPQWNGGGEAVITLPGQSASFAAGDPLPTAPIAGLSGPGPSGPLPIIGADGRTPFEGYARPFTPNGRPKVSLIIGGLGLNAKATRQAIEGLAPEITLSFVPYAEGLQGWIDLARAHGHEVLLEAPMEPTDYPDNDPGPYTLMTTAPAAETVKKLEWVLSRATGYFGVTNYLGSRFMTSDPALAGFTAALSARGLAFIDDGQAARRAGGLPRASADRIVDNQLSEAAVDQQLAALETSAQQHGQALGSGFAYPVTLTQVARWSESVEQRGYQLTPASALATRR
ncbi:MAG: divergent polysaccharide deacetylase family protein [Phenylobacterium sp.]|uniref:divergent polysaccharide deacetylase family protein n=1 Tax=Phenylobacterium sp. TaxID=1871053 RepID=UPI0027334D0C|nr:divergent polysaccharide deacetylase family protein [Phenylobacterium sp.]MDP3174080.1 divergent polysaccharide deacetylase family protein [Phenylobacterium sp.]